MRWVRILKKQESVLRVLLLFCVMISMMAFVGCGKQGNDSESQKEVEAVSEMNVETASEEVVESSQARQDKSGQADEAAEEKKEMKMLINGTEVNVAWEENESVDAIREIAAQGLEITMSMYGGFEQVGRIGQEIPANDEQITTEAGDIVLYSGDQLVVFYGSNSWDYTRLGHITDKTEAELEEMLGNGNVTITIK